MMFLQFFIWGSWFVTLALAMGNNGLAGFIGGAYESAPIAAIISPLFLGLIADRLFSSERVMGVLMLLGGGIMFAIAVLAPQGDAKGKTDDARPHNQVWCHLRPQSSVCRSHLLRSFRSHPLSRLRFLSVLRGQGRDNRKGAASGYRAADAAVNRRNRPRLFVC